MMKIANEPTNPSAGLGPIRLSTCAQSSNVWFLAINPVFDFLDNYGFIVRFVVFAADMCWRHPPLSPPPLCSARSIRNESDDARIKPKAATAIQLKTMGYQPYLEWWPFVIGNASPLGSSIFNVTPAKWFIRIEGESWTKLWLEKRIVKRTAAELVGL